MASMFSGNTTIQSFTAKDKPDLRYVTDMSNMFKNASGFNQNLNSWNVSNVKNVNGMFDGASSFNKALDARCLPNITEAPSDF